jgi:hypothetical protein
MDYDLEKKVSRFNMAQATLERINDCLVKGFNCYTDGNIYGWFYNLKKMKMQIISKLTKEERIKLEKIEKMVEKLFVINKKLVAVRFIEKYNEELQDMMEDKGLLLVDKESEVIFA